MTDEVERRARLICQALHGSDPDTPVIKNPLRLNGGELVAAPPGEAVALWKLYVPAAKIMVEDEERRKEHERLARRD